MSRRVTIRDIAKELNTTAATVSRALNDHPRISYEMKVRVQNCAEKLNFKINKIASSLRSGKSHLIGVMIPSAEINFFGSVVHGIESIANNEGYNVLIYQTNEMKDHEIQGIATFLSARVDGIVVSISKQTEDFTHFLEVKSKGIPIAFFDRHNDQLGIPSVVVDDFKGAYLATSHLIDQGYRHVAHVAGPDHVQIFHDRKMGYMQALKDHHRPIIYDWIVDGNVSIEAGRNGIKQLLKGAQKPDAVFAVEDFTALGAIKELKHQGIIIPTEFGVMGFANELFGEHITPSLSSIDQQTVNMGKEVCNLILEHIKNIKSPHILEVRNIKLEPIPVFRDSSNRKLA